MRQGRGAPTWHIWLQFVRVWSYALTPNSALITQNLSLVPLLSALCSLRHALCCFRPSHIRLDAVFLDSQDALDYVCDQMVVVVVQREDPALHDPRGDIVEEVLQGLLVHLSR